MTANLFCTARDEVRATRLVDELRQAGFTIAQLSAFVPELAVAGGFGTATVPQRLGPADPHPSRGSFCEWLYRMPEVELRHCAGLGRCLAVGQFAPALRKAGEAGFDSLEREFTRAGVPRAESYRQKISEGKILFSVHCDGPEETARVQSVLVRAGAEDVLTMGATSSREPRLDPGDYRHAA